MRICEYRKPSACERCANRRVLMQLMRMLEGKMAVSAKGHVNLKYELRY